MPDLVQQQARIIEAPEARVAPQKDQLAWLQKQVFGAKSARIVADPGQQSLPFAEAEAAVQAPEPVEEIHCQRRNPVKNRGRDIISYPNHLPVKRIELDIPAERKVCAQPGEPLVCIGREVTRKPARKTEQFQGSDMSAPSMRHGKTPIRVFSPPRCPMPSSIIARRTKTRRPRCRVPSSPIICRCIGKRSSWGGSWVTRHCESRNSCRIYGLHPASRMQQGNPPRKMGSVDGYLQKAASNRSWS